MSDEYLSSGTIIDGKYVILEPLGCGGMGKVYKARQLSLERSVALKILNQQLLGDAESAARFQREARILSGLEHKGIARFYSYGESAYGSYFAMEYVEGKSLRKVLNETPCLSWEEAFSIAARICEALSYAHAHGVVHRDLKPDNMLLKDSNYYGTGVVLIDFGLSKIICPGSPQQRLTATGELMGSVHYMCPELSLGCKADQRSDIYSLGCIIYEMISSQPPFEGDTPLNTIFKHANLPALPLAKKNNTISVPLVVDKIVLKSIEKSPDLRYQNAEALKHDLTSAIANNFDEVSIAGKATFLKRWIPISLLLLMGAVAFFYWHYYQTSSPSPAGTTVLKTNKEINIRQGGSDIKRLRLIIQERNGSPAKVLQEIEDLLPGLSGKPSLEFVAYYERGQCLLDLHRPRDAEASYQKAIGSGKNSDGSYFTNTFAPLIGLARAQIELQKLDYAEESLKKAAAFLKSAESLKNVPDKLPPLLADFGQPEGWTEVYCLNARVEQLRHNYAKAAEWIEKALQRSKMQEAFSTYADQTQLLADLLEKTGKTVEARKKIDGLLTMKVGFGDTVFQGNMAVSFYKVPGNWYVAHGYKKEGLVCLTKALNYAREYKLDDRIHEIEALLAKAR